jgi:hypothetical protein
MRAFLSVVLVCGLALVSRPVWGQSLGAGAKSSSERQSGAPPAPQPEPALPEPALPAPEASSAPSPGTTTTPAPTVVPQRRHTKHHSHSFPPGAAPVPAGGIVVPGGPGGVRKPWLLQRRLALIDRLRSSVEQSNPQMAERAGQLEIVVRKLHEEGPQSVMQMLGGLLAQGGQGSSAAASSPAPADPAIDLGEASPLSDAPSAEAPPKPKPDLDPESPDSSDDAPPFKGPALP